MVSCAFVGIGIAPSIDRAKSSVKNVAVKNLFLCVFIKSFSLKVLLKIRTYGVCCAALINFPADSEFKEKSAQKRFIWHYSVCEKIQKHQKTSCPN